MSGDESLAFAGSIEDLKYLDINQIESNENYSFKDPLDKSNKLQIFKSKDKIINAIKSNNIILISGATGCGKSTQVPQYILDDHMSRKEHCKIIVTQPRRIAAISISKQVNKERGWKNGQFVGYQVGYNKDFDTKTTKVLFCTTGILLQKIINEKSLCEFTHIILDEVHERSIEMDFLLLIIKKLLKTNSQSVHIILMSATANPYKLQEYFNTYYGLPDKIHERAQLITVDGTVKYSITKYYLDNLYGHIDSANEMKFNKPQIERAGYKTAIQLIKEFDIMETKEVINKNSSVLIFLPGLFEIEEMYRLMKNEMISENFKWTLLPLHSSITIEEQNRVFEKPPLNYRKIILATNIAESSITISDIFYVIDFCLVKQFKNQIKSNYAMLAMTWTSKSNCEQRAGRVGRVSEGKVFRLVPERMYNEQFAEYEDPEMKRCSLGRAVLMSKILDIGSPKELLCEALEPPSSKNIFLTILTLKQLGALLPTVNGQLTTMDGDLTFLGKLMARLPLEPPLSKLIYFGYIFNILNEAIIMACGLSIKSIFSQPFQKHLAAYTQKLNWANYSCSDPMAFINPYQSWLDRKLEFDLNRRLEKSWTQNNFIQLSAMRELHDLVIDVTDRLRKYFGIVANSSKMKWIQPEEKALACKVILAGAFYPNYFIRGASNSYVDEQYVLKLLDGHDPYRTVYFSGFPNNQPKQMYKKTIEKMFPEKFVGKPTAYFNESNKVYVEFQTTSKNDIVPSNHQNNCNQLVPGNICYGVFVAMKMNQLRHKFEIPFMKTPSSQLQENMGSNQSFCLLGPKSPLKMTVNGINHKSISKQIKIESHSVNSVLLDAYPNDYHERLFVAGNVSINEKDNLTLWDSTMMPNIPGIPAFMCLLFSPCVEIRYNTSFTKMIGAVCGLGYDPKSTMSLSMENDIEITFDTILDTNHLTNINIIRLLLSKCVNPEDEELSGVIETTHPLQTSLLELLNTPTKLKSPEHFPQKYTWGCIPNPRLLSPYLENTMVITHPMDDFNVYKLIWIVKTSSNLSQKDCENLIYKLSKIKLLKDKLKLQNVSSEKCQDELTCPLCDLNFFSNTSMEMHFNNHQHIERYQLAKNELLNSFKGPPSMIKHL